MSVWYCIPSKRPPEQAGLIIKQWRDKGYNVAVWRDCGDGPIAEATWAMYGKYPGYALAVNRLVSDVFDADSDCNWVVTGGDDVEPDHNWTALEIAAKCQRHFKGSYGVMQPTGDRWGATEPWAQQAYPDMPAYIDRVAGSPWLGREFCKRINQGRGPLWPEYFHMFVDEELQNVAKTNGVFQQRRDLIHLHRHWGRERGFMSDMPEFLAPVNTAKHWQDSKGLFERRRAAGFPGSEPL